MSEFTDIDLTVETDNDSDLVKQLRKQLKNANKKVETYEKQSRASTIENVLKAKGVNQKAAAKVPADLAATPEAIGGWLDEWADVFNISVSDAGDGDTQQVASTTQEGESDGGDADEGLTDEERAAYSAAARSVSQSQAPLAGTAAIKQQLADIKALPAEEAFQKLREAGLLGG